MKALPAISTKNHRFSFHNKKDKPSKGSHGRSWLLFAWRKGAIISKEPFESLPDVLDASQLAETLHLSRAGAYNLLNQTGFPTLHIGGRKMVMKHDLLDWLRLHTNRTGQDT